MTVVCAWCQRVLQTGTGLVSHGICPSCAETFEIGAGLERDGTQAAGPAPVLHLLAGATTLAAAFVGASVALDAVFA